jgi:hypothetical protein
MTTIDQLNSEIAAEKRRLRSAADSRRIDTKELIGQTITSVAATSGSILIVVERQMYVYAELEHYDDGYLSYTYKPTIRELYEHGVLSDQETEKYFALCAQHEERLEASKSKHKAEDAISTVRESIASGLLTKEELAEMLADGTKRYIR